jgi:putative inorganic carbon (HCO3(-)) transporter
MKMDTYRNWGLLLLSWFPLVDYLLRKIPVIGVLGSVWDKLILLVLAVVALKRYLLGERIESLPYHRVLIAFILLGVAYLAIDLSSFAVDFEGFRAVYWYMLYVFVLPYLIDEKFAKTLVRASLVAAWLISLHGIYQYIVKAPIPSNWVDAGETVRTRVFSVFGSPNIMGSYMILMFPTAAGMAWAARSRGERLFYGIIAASALAALVFTYTRGAWMALFAALVLLGILFDKRLLVVILVAAVAGLFVPAIHKRVFELFTPLYWMKSAKDGRIFRWLLAYDIIRHNPLFGAGLGHFGGAVAARNFNAPYSDNYYAKTLGEMGILGLGMMLTLFVTVMRNLYARIFKPLRAHPDWPLLVGMFTGCLAVLVQCAVENVFEVPAMNFLFWFYVTLMVVMTRSSRKEGSDA